MVYFTADNIITSLGFSTTECMTNMLSGLTGIKIIDNKKYYHEPFPVSVIDDTRLNNEFDTLAHPVNERTFTRLEKMMITSVAYSLRQSAVDVKSERTLFIISTTKGNIDLLSSESRDSRYGVHLWQLGDIISEYFGNPNKAVVISNACISGVLAVNTAAMYINSGEYDNVIVVGGDIVSRFVVSGFMSFLSLSPESCKPFDKDRNGLSLGEAAATVVLSRFPSGKQHLMFKGGGSANDANHISGPSRTGEGSFIAIKRAMEEAGLNDVDHISAHGTATPYNDEMESIAIARHGLENALVNSVKGFIGHTLGAAGVVETALLLEEMRQNKIINTLGYKSHGVSKPINVVCDNTDKELVTCLKMASGFGGSNAATIISKVQ